MRLSLLVVLCALPYNAALSGVSWLFAAVFLLAHVADRFVPVDPRAEEIGFGAETRFALRQASFVVYLAALTPLAVGFLLLPALPALFAWLARTTAPALLCVRFVAGTPMRIVQICAVFLGLAGYGWYGLAGAAAVALAGCLALVAVPALRAAPLFDDPLDLIAGRAK